LSLAGGLLTVWLMRRKSPFAFLAGILGVTVAAWALGLVAAPASPLSKPDFSLLLRLDPLGALSLALLPAIVSIFMTDLFDSVATFVGVAHATGLVDASGRPKNLRQGLIVDAWATLGAGALGTASGTAYIESAAGIEMGGRTGLTAVAAALCFLPCLFLAPLAGMVPPYATAPVLVIVGALMFRSVGRIDFSKLEDAVPAFLAIALVPLTFSITQGLLWGFVSHTTLYLVAGRRKELSPALLIMTAVSAALLLLEHTN
jgi:AGZA family xanthine/uracil permease-like MFS transporter